MHQRTDPQTSSDPDVLDLGKALSRLDNDAGFLKELFGLFQEDGPARGQTLTEALAADDLATAAKAAHSLKGMAGTISAPGLMDLAFAMERAAKQADATTCAALHPQLTAMLDAVLAAIDAFMTEH